MTAPDPSSDPSPIPDPDPCSRCAPHPRPGSTPPQASPDCRPVAEEAGAESWHPGRLGGGCRPRPLCRDAHDPCPGGGRPSFRGCPRTKAHQLDTRKSGDLQEDFPRGRELTANTSPGKPPSIWRPRVRRARGRGRRGPGSPGAGPAPVARAASGVPQASPSAWSAPALGCVLSGRRELPAPGRRVPSGRKGPRRGRCAPGGAGTAQRAVLPRGHCDPCWPPDTSSAASPTRSVCWSCGRSHWQSCGTVNCLAGNGPELIRRACVPPPGLPS